MKTPTPDREDIVKWVTDAYDKISKASANRLQLRQELTNSNGKTKSTEMDTDTVVKDFEEEGTITTLDPYFHFPTYYN
jgi:hypothetical protein